MNKSAIQRQRYAMLAWRYRLALDSQDNMSKEADRPITHIFLGRAIA